MREYKEAVLEIIEFDNLDVITTSNPSNDDTNGNQTTLLPQ